MALTLPDATKQDLTESIKHYFLTERDETIGDLGASFLLEFVLEEIGPSIYNQAIKDAQTSLHGTVADLDLTLHEPELGYSAEQRRKG